jgi:hypothetical protein
MCEKQGHGCFRKVMKMRTKLLAAVLAAAALGLASTAQAKWTPTPVPQRPPLPRTWPPTGSVPMYDDPGPYLRIAKGTSGTLPKLPLSEVYRMPSVWYPIGSPINVRIPARSTLSAAGPTRTVMPVVINPVTGSEPHLGGARCMWAVPTVLDALGPATAHRENDGTRDYSWRVRATNRGNVLWARITPIGHRYKGVTVITVVNYSNARVRVTIRCAPYGPQEPLVQLAPGVWVANPWVELQGWPVPGYPQVMPPAGERWQCTDPFFAPVVARPCRALAWS